MRLMLGDRNVCFVLVSAKKEVYWSDRGIRINLSKKYKYEHDMIHVLTTPCS